MLSVVVLCSDPCTHCTQPMSSTVVTTSAVPVSAETTRLGAASPAHVNRDSSFALRVHSPLQRSQAETTPSATSSCSLLCNTYVVFVFSIDPADAARQLPRSSFRRCFFNVLQRAWLLGYDLPTVGRRLRSPLWQLLHACYNARYAHRH